MNSTSNVTPMRQRILIDAGEGRPDYLPRLLSAMEGAGVRRVSDVLISHYHRDHTEGLIELRRHSS